MTDFMSGKTTPAVEEGLSFQELENGEAGSPLQIPTKPLEFSPEAKAVFEAGRELWRYYHQVARNTPSAQAATPLREGNVYNPNASLYDIKAYFQGRNDKGKMNNKSDDQEYMRLLTSLRDKLKVLAVKIQPKVYEYGFLKK